jgi:zinc protease
VSASSQVSRTQPPGPGALRPYRFPDTHHHRLSNGSRVVFARVPGAPVVTLSVVLDAGALSDDGDHLGIAALTAELLESGTEKRSGIQLARDVESLGVHLDTGAGWDSAQAGVTMLSDRLAPAVEILANVVREPSFPDEEVARLRAERLAEILQRRAEPGALATEAAARFIYRPDARFSRPLGGLQSTVSALTREDVRTFHAERFAPRSASFVIAGDVEPDAALDLLERHFGDWQSSGNAAPQVPGIGPRATEVQVVIVDRPDAVQSEIRVGHLGIPRSDERYFPTLVMNAILGGTFSSRLNLNLRERHGFTYGVHSAFAMRKHAGSFVVSTAVQTEVTAAAVREIVDELSAIRDSRVSDAELADARNFLAGVFPLRLETTDGVAGRLLELTVYDLPTNYFDDYRERILAVSAEEVQACAIRNVRPDELAIVIVGDAATLKPALEGFGSSEIQVLAAEGIQDA